MESSIKIDFRDLPGEAGLQPVIAVKLIDSEDPRDKLVKSFFQALGGESSWLVVKFDHHIIQGVDTEMGKSKTFITIRPVRSDELRGTVEIISSRINGRVGSTGPINLNPVN